MFANLKIRTGLLAVVLTFVALSVVAIGYGRCSARQDGMVIGTPDNAGVQQNVLIRDAYIAALRLPAAKPQDPPRASRKTIVSYTDNWESF